MKRQYRLNPITMSYKNENATEILLDLCRWLVCAVLSHSGGVTRHHESVTPCGTLKRSHGCTVTLDLAFSPCWYPSY